MGYTVSLILINLMLSFIPAGIAKTKGRSFVGYLLISFFLSFAIGMLLILCQDDLTGKIKTKTKCLSCGALVRDDQKCCNKCGSDDLRRSTPKEPLPFVSRYLGLILLGVMLVMALWMSSGSEQILSLQTLGLQLRKLTLFVLIAVGFVLCLRAKGPDLSLTSMIGVAAVIAASVINTTGSFAVGAAAAMLVCAAAGAVNGWITAYLKVPSVIPTLVMSQILRMICILIPRGPFIKANLPLVETIVWVGLTVAIIVGFLLVFFTKLGQPLQTRAFEIKRPLVFVTFIVSAVLAGIAGLTLVVRIQSAHPKFGDEYNWFLLLLFGAIMSTRAADNRFLPVIYAVIVSVVCTLLSSAMNFVGISPYYQHIILYLFTAVFLIVTFFSNREPVRQMMRFKQQAKKESDSVITQGV